MPRFAHPVGGCRFGERVFDAFLAMALLLVQIQDSIHFDPGLFFAVQGYLRVTIV